MQTLAFDGRTGASGDMILGALVAVGADPDVLSVVEEALDVEYRIGETEKNGIAATTVDVVVEGDGAGRNGGNEHDHGDDHEHAHDGDHEHSHEDGHDHEHGDGRHDHAEGRGPNRTYAECREIVEAMALPAAVEADATAVFRLLGEAEGAVHGTDLASTHFHEVGADDAIADVVGACLLLDDLAADRVVTTPVSAGGGEVSMSHGRYPVPAPAVVELAAGADWELRGGPVDVELLTPTGAAILAHVAEGVGSFPPLRVAATGYGAGTRDLDDRANVLRATVGERRGGLVRDDVRVLETNLDDASPELLGSLQRSLREAGARDVSILPATMKKSRPGHLVKVVAPPADARAVARRLAEETGTLGVREASAGHRWIAERRTESVDVEIDGERHAVAVKVASDDAGTVYDVSAEFDDADAVAAETGLATREVMRRAEAELRDRLE